MIEKILQWAGTAFAIIGVVFLFIEAIGSIRKHNNTKLSVLGLVFLSVSLVGYVLTEVILRAKGLPVIFSCLWLLFMWAYLICNLVSAIKLSKKVRKEKLDKTQSDALDATEQIAQQPPTATEQTAERIAADVTDGTDIAAAVTDLSSDEQADGLQAEEKPVKKRKKSK